MKYVKPERLFLRAHPSCTEKWVQEKIAEDPAILGLGELVLKDKERMQPRAGRLDLLLQDVDSRRRYEVELQLGKTDEAHIIRTIEYWDIERKRYPQYDHTAVIVAEEITSRFLNVIGLFNGHVPLIALQMSAFRHDDVVFLVFTTVLDELRLGDVDDDEETAESTDRAYWEKRASAKSLQMADDLLKVINSWDPSVSLKYNKFYIGLARDGQARNFVVFKPKKDWLRVEPRLPWTDELQRKLEEAGLDVMEYDRGWGRYRIRVAHSDLPRHKDTLGEVMRLADGHASG